MNMTSESNAIVKTVVKSVAEPKPEPVVEDVEKVTPEPEAVETETTEKTEPEVKQEPGTKKEIDKSDKADKSDDDDLIFEKGNNNQRQAWERIRRKKERLAIENQFLKEQLTQRNQQPQQSEKPIAETNATNTAPSREQFNSDDEYINAVIDFKVEQRTKNLEQTVTQRQEQSAIQNTWQEKEAIARKAYPDYDEVVSEKLLLPQEAIDAIVLSPVGVDLRYYLGTHTDEAESINRMSPIRAAVEIGKIEAKLEVAKQTKTKPPVKASAAPEPIKPIGSRGKSVVNADALSDDEFFAKRKKERLLGKVA